LSSGKDWLYFTGPADDFLTEYPHLQPLCLHK
jgi:hypothetical protein